MVKYPMLSPLANKIPKYEIFSFDIETTTKENNFLMGSIYGRDLQKTFWDKREMIDFIKTNSYFYLSTARMFATNLYFDYTSLFKGTEEIKHIYPLFRGSKVVMCKFKIKPKEARKHHKTITFLDTMNYSQMSVKQMGQIVGLEKYETPLYILEERLPRKDEYAYIEKYNMRDSEITYLFANFLQDSFNKFGCKMRITAASTAMDLFQRRYLKQSMYQEPRERMELEYNAYYGGRCEVFKRGLVRDVNYYDFNSLYPSVMLGDYPNISYSHYTERGEIDFIDYDGISEVRVRCPDDLNIPFLPLHHNNKTMFPTGEFNGWYSNVELRYALELGYKILDVKRQIYYTRTHRPFEKYVSTLYALRKAMKYKKDPAELIMKLMMNSLYGKFGQKMYGKEQVFHLDSISVEQLDKMSKNGEVMIQNDYVYYKEEKPKYVSSHILPIYALYTTALGKIKMYEAMKDIEVIYVDTDSIITPDYLEDSTEIGMVKKEYSIKEGIFIKPKMYGFTTTEGKDIVRIKGNPASFSWDYQDFKMFIDRPQIDKQMFSTFKMSNKKRISYNSIIDTHKEFSLEDEKRVWQETFNPLEIQNSKPVNLNITEL